MASKRILKELKDLQKDRPTSCSAGHSAAAMKKGGLTFSGRKSLDGLSNSGHPSVKEASEKMVTKKKISKADTGPRKVLSDISNQASRKKHSIKLPAESFNEKDIEYGGLFHDHRKCIKAQNIRTQHHMDHFPMTVGLVNGCPKELSFLEKPESPPRLLEEMLEQPILDRSLDHSPPESPDYCKYWEDYCKYWEDRHAYVNFKLIDSSKLVKH